MLPICLVALSIGIVLVWRAADAADMIAVGTAGAYVLVMIAWIVALRRQEAARALHKRNRSESPLE